MPRRGGVGFPNAPHTDAHAGLLPCGGPLQGPLFPLLGHAALRYLCPSSLPTDPSLRVGNKGLTPGTSSVVASGGMVLRWVLLSEGDFFSLALAILGGCHSPLQPEAAFLSLLAGWGDAAGL